MIKKHKSNKLLSVAIISLCLVIIFNPKIYANSCLNAITVWAVNVLPVLFPFFVFTRLIIYLTPPKKSVLDKPFMKLFNSPAGSSMLFLLSALSGYPMGAKLISNVFERGSITRDEAESMLAYCSVSGPMFMIGSVGVGIFLSFKAGVIILISNLIAALVNGFIFRVKKDKKHLDDYLSVSSTCELPPPLARGGKKLLIENSKKESKNNDAVKDYKSLNVTKLEAKQDGNILADSVYDSLVSILMVGAYIALSFLIVDMFKNLGVLKFLSTWISKPFKLNANIVEAVLCGLFEITRGSIEINSCAVSLGLKTIIASGLIGFGGVSIIMQSISFMKNLNIKLSHMIKQKLSQGILSTLFALLLTLICF